MHRKYLIGKCSYHCKCSYRRSKTCKTIVSKCTIIICAHALFFLFDQVQSRMENAGTHCILRGERLPPLPSAQSLTPHTGQRGFCPGLLPRSQCARLICGNTYALSAENRMKRSTVGTVMLKPARVDSLKLAR